MDEQRLIGAMRDAAADAPPPSFDAADVVRTSHRVTARRRAATAGAALAAVLVVGVGVGVGIGTTRGADTTTAAAPAREPAPELRAAPPAADAQSSGAESAASPRPPLGPADPNGCANPQDPALRALVDEVLPEAVGAPMAPTTMECRAGGGRGVHLVVGGGVLVVDYAPSGVPSASRSDGGTSLPTASGGTVQVVGTGTDIPEGRLAQAAAELAPQL